MRKEMKIEINEEELQKTIDEIYNIENKDVYECVSLRDENNNIL